jgi:hypothetical protein
MSEVVERAIERYRRTRILERANRMWAELIKDSAFAAAIVEEDAEIEATFGSWVEGSRREA